MNCEQAKEQMMDWVRGDRDPDGATAFQEHLARCAACAEESGELARIWRELACLPEQEPSPHLRPRFFRMLEAYEQGQQQQATPIPERVRPWYALFRPWSLVAAALLLGLLLGRTGFRAASPWPDPQHLDNPQLVSNQSPQDTLFLENLFADSAGDRLHALNRVSQSSNPRNELLGTLILVLRQDPNVNVRLAAVDALLTYQDQPRAREALIQALAHEPSPLVQMALAEALAEAYRGDAVPALEQLLYRTNLEPSVQTRAKMLLSQIR